MDLSDVQAAAPPSWWVHRRRQNTLFLDPGGVHVFNSSRLRQLGSLSHHPLPDVGVDSQWCDVGVITIPVRVWKARGQDPNC